MSNSAALRRLGLLLAGALAPLLLGCTQEPREVPPTDCSVDAAYEYYPLFVPSVLEDDPTTMGDEAEAAKTAELGNWYASGDLNAAKMPGMGSYVTYDADTAVVCGHTVGKHFAFGLNHDWGAVGGRWQALTGADADASEYEGFSFWGQSLYDRSIELNLSDVHSADPPAGADLEETCIPDVIPGSTTKEPNPDFVDENGVPRANSCGSLFSRRLIMSKSWTLYTIPFSDFIQINRDPRFKPGGLETSAMRIFSFRIPKDTFVDVSFVNFAWYRKATN
jgi:hypothetical protein